MIPVTREFHASLSMCDDAVCVLGIPTRRALDGVCVCWKTLCKRLDLCNMGGVKSNTRRLPQVFQEEDEDPRG